MAKDGTNRGGARIGAGAKKKPLADKIAEGNPGKRTLTVINFDDRAADLEGQAIACLRKSNKQLLLIVVPLPFIGGIIRLPRRDDPMNTFYRFTENLA